MIEVLSADLSIRGEMVATEFALDRVLKTPISAPHALPPFARSTVDGYAVLAEDTYGANTGLPAYLSLVGEIRMGARADIQISPTQAALIHTGGMIPQGSNAVVMLEDTQKLGTKEIEVYKPVASGDNILQEGEDIHKGDVVFTSGLRLRSQDIGGLMALGITEIEVAKRPRVGIISTGNEVIPPHEDAKPGQVRDVNSYTLAALVKRAGGEAVRHGIIKDEFEQIYAAAKRAHEENDIVIITAGSSVSAHDITSDVINALGDPGVLVHGISIKPGKPTILAVADGVPVIGLPGNPVSALVIAGNFLTPLIHMLLGITDPSPVPRINARLSINLNSQSGREDYVPVQLVETTDGTMAEPVFGRSNLIFTLIRADGLITIAPEVTGLPAGSDVIVELFPW